MAKAKITYHNLNDDAPTVETHGVSFTHNVPVEIDLDDANNDGLVDVALQNKFFEVQGVPAHDELMAARAKRGTRPAKTEIELHKKIEPMLAERDKKLAEAEATKQKADAAALKAIEDAERNVANARAEAIATPPSKSSK